MDIQFYGANCVTITYKGVRLVIDDNLAELGGKSIVKADDIVLYTGPHADDAPTGRLMFDSPGEFEVADISIVGIPERLHIDESGLRSTMFKIITSDLSLLVVGHVYPNINEDQLERIGLTDIMIVPVGGSGYTLDPLGALKLIKEVEPKLIIPTHYAMSGINYPVPQTDLQTALKELGMESREQAGKLKLKPADITDVAQLVVLEKS
ncbi:MAG: MBL fold metallo-hydrolase [Patescibacteria group bacterium]|nr:MBL fold metallo-hydrolase [Patescibacteria group bacterium]